jgi:serine/threonine protein kinase
MRTEVTGAPDISGYQHVRLISASGGYGDVHLYEETELGRQVAVKVIRETDLSPATVERFMAEANAMAALEHPNIVRVYGAGRTADGRPYIAMQYCPQPTMDQRAAVQGLGVAEVLRIGIGIGSAIETAHRAGLLHRDIKPANILTTPWGAPGLTDFGVAARIGAGESSADDDVGVSVPWSPPEMLFTTTAGTPSSDVYSLAATVWHLLVGHSPFEVPRGDNSRMALMGRIRDLSPPAIGRPDVPESLERLLRHGMAKAPEARPQTMAGFVRSLQAVETELHLPQTQAVYVDPAAAQRSPRAADTATGPPTRLRPRPAASAPPSPPEAAGNDSLRTQLRPRSTDSDAAPPAATPEMSAQEDRTQLRPKATQVDLPVGRDPAPPARSRRLWTMIGVALLIVAVVGGYWLTGGRSAAPPPTSVTASSANPDVGLDDTIPPGPVTVTGKRSGSSVKFSWDYSAALSSDTYRWEVVGGRSGIVSTPAVTIPAPAGTRVCLRVIVVRADGSNASKNWSPEGCTG